MILHSQARIDAYTAAGWWGTETLDDLFRHNVAARPDAPALADPPNRADLTDGNPQKWTYAELDTAVDQLATVLIQNGIGKDDVVALQLPNIGELVIGYLALARVGAIASPLPVQYREYELEMLGNFVEARAALTAMRFGERPLAATILGLQEKIPTLETVLAWGDNVPEGAVALDTAAAAVTDTAELDAYLSNLSVDANEIYTICWTSGTESRPKGVPRSHNDWIAISYATVDGAELTGDDVLLCPFPLVNMAGIGGMLVPWLVTNSTLVMHQPFDLPTFLKQVAIERISYTVAPPPLLNLLLIREEILESADISSLRVIGSGSAPLSPWMVRGWQEKHNIPVTNLFGSNEGAALLSTAQDIPDPEKRALFFPRYGVEGFAWSGRVPEGIQTRLVAVGTDETITEPGIPGELRIKGPTVFAGYWKGDEQGLRPFDKDGYFCTGDMFEIAGAGEDARYYRFIDRVKDTIIRGGMNISAAEVETLIQGHPQVADTAVVAYPDDVLGEKVCAFVVPRDGQEIGLDDLVAYLRQKKIASYKLPERMELVEALPRNPVGKVLKRDLRARLLSA